MRTKLFTLFLAFAASVGALFAVNGTCGANLTWDYTNGVLTISGSGDMTNWSRSSDVPWDSYQVDITSVIIGNSVTSIGDYAFYNCWCRSVTIPNSVKSIGRATFSGCSGLKSITIPNSVTSIGQSAFSGCSGLTSVTIPNSVTGIGDHVFSGCLRLTSVTIPNSVISIGDYAFDCCYDLTSITIPNSVTSIGKDAFSSCGLTSITIPNSVTTIGEAAFAYCGLTSVTIGNSVTSIGEAAFIGCYDLTSITIGNSVTSIGKDAFSGCSGLTSVTIPNSVTSIGQSAFSGCSGLTSITCNANVPPTCGYKAFYNVDKSIPLYVPSNSVKTYKAADTWKEFTNIQSIQSEEQEVTEIIAEPTDNSVVVQWSAVSGAATYELVIKDKSGNVICTLVFDADGQLIPIAFNAPAHGNARQQTQDIGFSYTVTGLEGGTAYDLTITSKDSNGATLKTETISFVTEGEASQDVDNIQSDHVQCPKVIRNGQILIHRGDHTYTLTGQEVK